MRVLAEDFQAHLQSGATTLCRCWQVTRRDGVVLGFTDHDRPLSFDGVEFKANTGLDAAALQQSSGLNVDNSQAVGALSDLRLTDHDILAGFYDGAEVLAWLVNWADVSERVMQFRGTIGEIKRGSAGFEAELRGLSEALNQPAGLAYHKACSAVLGDARCRFDLDAAGYVSEIAVEAVEDNRVFRFADLTGFDERWFEKGRAEVLSGNAKGSVAVIKADRFDGQERVVSLWEELRSDIVAGDVLRLEAGCDKRAESCKLKFLNFENFRGFPHLPGDDWAASYPVRGGVNDGESRY